MDRKYNVFRAQVRVSGLLNALVWRKQTLSRVYSHMQGQSKDRSSCFSHSRANYTVLCVSWICNVFPTLMILYLAFCHPGVSLPGFILYLILNSPCNTSFPERPAPFVPSSIVPSSLTFIWQINFHLYVGLFYIHFLY